VRNLKSDVNSFKVSTVTSASPFNRDDLPLDGTLCGWNRQSPDTQVMLSAKGL
jgi:hypothetical protein